MGQSQGTVCFHFNMPRVYIWDAYPVNLHFIEFGEKLAVATVHHYTFAQDFFLVTSMALILHCVSRAQLDWHNALLTWPHLLFGQ